MAALRALALGNQRYVKGRPRPDGHPSRGLVEPIAAILCPAGQVVSPEALFDAAPGELYVLQGDMGEPSADLLAGLEWAAAKLGIQLTVILGGHSAGAELAIQLAPFGMHVVNAIVGPNEMVRFEPARGALSRSAATA